MSQIQLQSKEYQDKSKLFHEKPMQLALDKRINVICKNCSIMR